MPGITSKLQTALSGFWSTTMGPTNTQRRLFEEAKTEFGPVYDALKQLIDTDLPALEKRVEATGALSEPKASERMSSTQRCSFSASSSRRCSA